MSFETPRPCSVDLLSLKTMFLKLGFRYFRGPSLDQAYLNLARSHRIYGTYKVQSSDATFCRSIQPRSDSFFHYFMRFLPNV